MAYLKGYEFDIFISYAHVDNATIDENAKGWVESFHKAFEILINQRIGRASILKIWRDEKLASNAIFDKEISDRLKASALLISLTSKAYIASDYCKKELSEFYKKAVDESLGLSINNQCRISNVLLNNLNQEIWPDEFAGAQGAKMYEAKGHDDTGWPLEPGSEKFKKNLRQLVDDVFKLLQACQQELGIEQTSKDTEPEMSGVPAKVFFAEVSDSLRTLRKRIIQQLIKSGIQVESNIPPPFEAEAHEKEVRDMLNKSTVSIHLLDQFTGREIENDRKNFYSQKQAEMALQYGKEQFFWVPKELLIDEIDEERHSNLLRKLKSGDRGKQQFSYVEGRSAHLPRDITDWIKKVCEKKDQVSDESAVLLDTHIDDNFIAAELMHFLVINHFQTYLIQSENNPRANMELFTERLKKVDTLVVPFGLAPQQWVAGRIETAIQTYTRDFKQYKVKAFYVYICPPKKKQADFSFAPGLFKINVLDNSHSNHLDPKIVAPLLDRKNSREDYL